MREGLEMRKDVYTNSITKILTEMFMGIIILTILVSCINNSSEMEGYEEDANDIIDTSGDISSPICFDKASYLFERLDVLLDADDGYLWGINLHGPVVIVDELTRYAVANMPDEREIFSRQGDLYVGRLPEETIMGVTASEFGGRLWGMVTWGFIENEGFIDSEEVDSIVHITDTMLHELFHARQHLFFEGELGGYPPSHLNNLDARINLRLELNVLLHALRTTGEDRRLAVADALSIRAERHRLYPDDIQAENLFEASEGTAVYTEAILGRDNLADRIALLEIYRNHEDLSLIYFYYTGAAYALLLDEFSIEWREGIRWDTDLAEILGEGIGFTEVTPFNEIDIENYGYLEIRSLEEAWVAENERLIGEAEDALSGSLLFLDTEGEFDFFSESVDIRILDLEQDRTVFYGDFTYTTHYGKLELTGGFLQLWSGMGQHAISASDMEVDGNRIITPNWVLTLNEGYRLREFAAVHFGIAEQD